MNFGQNLQDCRVARGYTQAELAEKVGISRSSLAAIEIGGRVLSLPMAVEMAKALEVPVMWIIEGIKE